MTRVYVTGRAIAWNATRIADPDGPTPNGPGLGFLPIYGSIGQAEREQPGAAVYPIDVPDDWVEVARPRGPSAGVA